MSATLVAFSTAPCFLPHHGAIKSKRGYDKDKFSSDSNYLGHGQHRQRADQRIIRPIGAISRDDSINLRHALAAGRRGFFARRSISNSSENSKALLPRAALGAANCQHELRFLLSAGRLSAHFRIASSVGQRDWPQGVKQYSTLGGT
jgi:hypothetical protein